MPTSSRQSSLFGVQDWKKLYETFREADLQSYDYESLRKSFIDYLIAQYPETFNDFVESSEYVALLDVIAFMGQALAFRSDLNARENFIDTAERRDSVIKLANLVGYTPKRNIAASGMLKIVSVQTTESVIDLNGTNISNRPIIWNDPSNAFWQSQMNSIINSALISTQYVGRPGNSKELLGIKTDEYSVQIPSTNLPVVPFTALVDNITMSFELTSMTSLNSDSLYEQSPGVNTVFNILYRNDKLGYGSSDTGWFVFFKQGRLQNNDFTYTNAIENTVQLIDIEGINNTDTWLYELDSQGSVVQEWKQVESVYANSNLRSTTDSRKIFSVLSRFNDQVSYVFGDGVTSDIPVGSFRAYVRSGNGLSYRIDPAEMQSVLINIPYENRVGRVETLTLLCDLQNPITSSQTRETLSSIKQRAPARYYTQNRMVNGEDYTNMPYTLYSEIIKSKAINRTSVGVSRNQDLLDPTSKYSSTNVVSDDGALWLDSADYITKESSDRVVGSPKTNTVFSLNSINFASEFLSSRFQSIVGSQSSQQYYQQYYPRYSGYYDPASDRTIYWNLSTVNSNTTTGYLYIKVLNSSDKPISVGMTNGYNPKYIGQGAMIKFIPSSGYTCFDRNNRLKTGTYSPQLGDKLWIWAGVISVIDDGSNYGNGNLDTGIGPITLSEYVPTGAQIEWKQPQIRAVPKSTQNFTVNAIAANNKTLTLNVYSESSLTLSRIDHIAEKMTVVGHSGVYIESVNTATNTVELNTTISIAVNDPIVFEYSTITVFTTADHELLNGERVQLTGILDVAPTTVNNVKYYAKVIDSRRLELYQNFDGISFTGTIPVTYAGRDNTGSVVPKGTAIIPAMDSSLSSTVIQRCIVAIQLRQNFALKFDNLLSLNQERWSFVQPVPTTNVDPETYWMRFYYDSSSEQYIVYYRSLKIYFGSVDQVRFFFDRDERVFDQKTGRTIADYVNVMRTNSDELRGGSLGVDTLLDVIAQPLASDGFVDDYRVEITSIDDDTGFTANPDFFTMIAPPQGSSPNLYPYVFFKNIIDNQGVNRQEIIENNTVIIAEQTLAAINNNRYVYPSGTIFYLETPEMSVISAISKGASTRIQFTTNHSFYDGYKITINNVEGMTALNSNQYWVKLVPGSTTMIDIYQDSSFTIAVNSTSYSDYQGGGIASVGRFFESTKNETTNIVTILDVTQDYTVSTGRGGLQFQYRHNSNNTSRVDPSTTNIIDVYVITNGYYTDYTNWLKDTTDILSKPSTPTIRELRQQFAKINDYKMLSDTVILNSVVFKPLFGSKAQESLRGKLKIVKSPLTNASDTQVRSSVLSALNDYFSIDKWDFGDTFFFSELSAYLHTTLKDYISTVVVVPTNSGSKFGDLYEVRSAPYEIFVNGATADDIVIVSSLTAGSLKV